MREGAGRSLASLLLGILVGVPAVLAVPGPAAAAPEGQITSAQVIAIAPRWFDPAEAEGIITPFIFYYALHDALVKPMPGNPLTPCLAESWNASADGLTYEFALRKGVKFHNGDTLSAEDVKFSFERYRGAAAKTFKERVSAIEVVDPLRVRIRLKHPWPDFLTFYGAATGAGWVVPKKYVEKVGDDGFKKHPIGAGPFKFVAYKPGVELALEAHDQFWRKTPGIKRLVFKSVPDESTRLAMVKRGETDLAAVFWGELAAEIKRTPGLTLKPTYPPVSTWLVFTEQWDPKSPWHDRRVRLAANLAIDREAINQAQTLGLSKVSASIIPQGFEHSWPAPLYPFDPQKAKRLLAEAGYPNGFDAGTLSLDPTLASTAEAVTSYFGAVGIRVTLRPLERAAFFKEYQEKRLKNLVLSASAALGNAATRLEAFVASTGVYTYGTYPDIEGLLREQAAEYDAKKRAALLHRVQQLIHDKVMYAPIMEPAILYGVGPRVAESALGLITNMAGSAPYEELRLKDR
jgi:peptide/nickel transport system substrate-binding protein